VSPNGKSGLAKKHRLISGELSAIQKLAHAFRAADSSLVG